MMLVNYNTWKRLNESKDSSDKPYRQVSPYGAVSWYKDGKLHREDGPAYDNNKGTKEWWVNGLKHREDGPAVEYSNGTKEWWVNGRQHREDGPAVEWASGNKHWYQNDRLHRDDGPSVIDVIQGIEKWHQNGLPHRDGGPAVQYKNGGEQWYQNGLLHREGGPAIYSPADGVTKWYQNGKLHREGGPAITYADGTKRWYIKDKLHREDGPAVEQADGKKEYWLDSRELTYEHFCERMVVVEGISPKSADIKTILRIKDGDPAERVKGLSKAMGKKKGTPLVRLAKAAIAVFGKDNKEISDFLISKLNLSFNTEEIDNIFSYHHSNIFDLEGMSDIFGKWDDNW